MAKGGLDFALLPYGNTWRTTRRSIHGAANINAAKSYVPYQDLENKQMLVERLDDPADFVSQIQRYTFSATEQMIVGYRAVDKRGARVREFYYLLHEFSKLASSALASLLDVFPHLQWLPECTNPAMRRGRAFQQREERFVVQSWMPIKRQILEGTAKPCVAERMRKAQAAEGLRDEQAAYHLGVLREGGADTSAATLPGVQVKAHEELDRVCGDRLPTMDDHAPLPYLRASVKEALRWFSTGTRGIPHAVVRDDEYRGYKIPKGAALLPPIWTLNHDPARYAQPRVFDPARFLGDETTAAESAASNDASKRDHVSLGAGRRIGPGMHIAERTLFLAMARLLWGFELSEATREVVPSHHGEGQPESKRPPAPTLVEVTPHPDILVEGLWNYPVPFPAHHSAEEHQARGRDQGGLGRLPAVAGGGGPVEGGA